jgi:hypothetical protein
MQFIDDPAAADFVLIDDEENSACTGAIETIRLDSQAVKPDLTVALSGEAAKYRIYVRSARFSEQDAAALFAVMWRNSHALVAAQN